jgi:hypothetical protein
MRPLLALTAALVLAGPAAAQPAGATYDTLLVRTEIGAWAATHRAMGAFALVGALDSFTEDTVDDLLVRVRRRAYQAGLDAQRATVLFQQVASLRRLRGDPRDTCADESEALSRLERLRSAGDDLVELDARVFSADEPFDAARIRAALDEHVRPLRVLVARRLDAPENVCGASPTYPHEHAP